MKRGLLLILISCTCAISTLAQNKLWSDVQRESLQTYTQRHQQALPSKYRFTKLNRSEAGQLQRQAPMERTAVKDNVSPVQFDIPLPDGDKFSGYFLESPVLSAELQRQYSNIKTYEIIDLKTKSSAGRVTITQEGVTGLLFTSKGNVYVSPVGKEYPDVHMVYYVKDSKKAHAILCGVQEEATSALRVMGITAGDGQLRTYRLAVAATGEYTAWAGSQANAIGYITTTVNNVTAIYERDATIRFTLVTNNSIIYTNPAADPYPTVASPNTTTLNNNNTAINTNIGSGLYDLGIVFNNGWDGGLAQLSSVCGASKGCAAAGLTFGSGPNPVDGPQGPIFDGTVAHEIAHQFSATHSFAATNGSCGSNVTAATAYEPGGGSTIMAYTNVCAPNYFQAQSDLYFHGGNILQIQSFATGATGSSCPVITPSGNIPPAVSVFTSAYTIPISTPFIISANGSDADGNNLTYTWDQVDGGFTTAAAPSPSNTSGPNFRSYPPSSDPSRTFPRMADIAAGISPAYEVLSSANRTMHFQVMVRDNAAGGGCTDEDNLAVTTNTGAGPFIVTSQSAPVTWTANGSNTATITWNVANTNAAPINCSNVDILLSIDGGLTYPYTLVANTANDGSQAITIPNIPTFIGRILVRSVNNIFFNINTANITIASACSAEGTTVDPATTVTGNAGNASLNLSLNPSYGSIITPITGQLTTGDPFTNLTANNTGPGDCIQFSNQYRYDTYRFTVNVPGNYTFARSGGTDFFVVYNLYLDSFDPVNSCTNFVTSNFTSSTSTIAPNIIVSLTPGIYYTLTVGTFNELTSQPALPANYTINVTPPAGGNLYNGAPDPGAGFNYAFVIVDNTSGDILGIDPAPGPDLSNSATYPPGTYTVYGLSYSNTISLATLNGYVGELFTTLQNDALFNPATFCTNISKNTVAVNVLATLPVQLLPLQAFKVNNTALLKWGTGSEQNSSHFEVLRSSDGANFDHIVGRVEAQGNSVSTTQYAFTDVSPEAGVNYYRIRELDRDGQSVLSNIASVNMDQPFKAALVYPNPAKNSLTLEYYSERREDIKVQIIDSKGSVVRQWQLTIEPGRNLKNMNLNGLAKGMYALQTIGINGTMVSRFVKE